MSRIYSRPRAYFWSLLTHGVLVAGLFAITHRTERLQREAARQQAAREHAPVYRQTEAESHARQLRRIRELAERLDAPAASPDTPDRAAPSASVESPADPTPASDTNDHRKSTEQLWRESREDFEIVRERLLDRQARRLAQIQQTDEATARRQLKAQASEGSSSPSSDPPATAGEAAEAIARLHGEAQQMLGRALQQAQGERDGEPLALEDAREAYVLTQNPQQAREVREFDAVVDWTALMGHPLSTTSVHGVLEPERDFRHVERGRESELRARFNATADAMRFGRRIGPTGTEPAKWICPDSWYIIGPFENAGRSAVDRTFPPEIEIDRDATYEGKGGRPVSWEFVRVRTRQVIPPHLEEYAVYYAYTEIYSEQSMDCWLALGGDDYSKLWVNDHLVWSGSKNEKGWTPTEGFRRVRFDAGFNRLLFRLENGWREAEFSLLVSLEP